MENIKIRWAKPEEWAPAMTMIWKTFLEFEGKEYTQEGIRNFFDFITDDKLYQSFLRGTYQMVVAVDKERVVGVATVRNGHHLSLLFVDEEYHHRGIGSAMLTLFCRYLKEEAGERLMSLKAAPSALGFYQKLGFRLLGPEEDYEGIRVFSMEKIFE
ncbi:MAG: GNAT family N-acetyltransferase [Roseburia sp.]|nr:GNAT family N-acetyltransferase [Roseburia sp.]